MRSAALLTPGIYKGLSFTYNSPNWELFSSQLLSRIKKTQVINQKMTSWRCFTCWPVKLWRHKMMSLVNKSGDWTPNYHKILIFFPTKSLKSLRAARIDQLADSNEPAIKMTLWRCLTCWPVKLWRRKMMSLVNKSADWPPPNYHKILISFPIKIFEKSLRSQNRLISWL